MNTPTSGCSTGCESGWTMYLDQSSISQEKDQDFIRYKNKLTGDYLDRRDEEDEDLSMVSDASSGPPRFGENDKYYFDELRYCYSEEQKKWEKKNKSKEKKSGKKKQFLHLDDTASSPIKSHMVIPPSGASMEQGTHYKQNSAFQNRIGFSQSSMSKK